MVKPVGHANDGVDNGQNLVSRRQMLVIAGGAGVASLVAACSTARSAPAATQTPTPRFRRISPRRSHRRRWSPG